MAERDEGRREPTGSSDRESAPLPSPLEGEPPVMWPGADSGFEADPLSPAGSAQRTWAFWQHLGRRRAGKVAVWVILGLIILLPVVSILAAVLHRH
jgi:hypothetical protein